MIAERGCEVCGARARELLYEVAGYPIVRCRECGLVFVGGEARPQELLALYDEAYYEDAEQPGYDGYFAAEPRKRLHDRTLLDLIERRRRPGSLMEIGCAYGYFLDEARRRGWQVSGVEPSAHAARHAREALGLDVSERPFSELAVKRESIDVIALWDVIEHLPNPRETLERARDWLRPGGLLALSTGNVESLAARLHGADWSLMTPPWHQFYFSRRTLRALLGQLGFVKVRFGGDGSLAVDVSSRRPRVPGPVATVLLSGAVLRLARRLRLGSIMFVLAEKVPG